MTKFTILYKSGHKVEVECESMTVVAGLNGQVRQISYTGMTPYPMHLGIEEIETIWEETAE